MTIARGFFFVSGQVQRPGQYNYLGRTTVTETIESAGGFTEFAARWAVKLTRSNGKAYKVDCRRALKEPSLDLPIYPGDKIHVPMRGPKSDM